MLAPETLTVPCGRCPCLLMLFFVPSHLVVALSTAPRLTNSGVVRRTGCILRFVAFLVVLRPSCPSFLIRPRPHFLLHLILRFCDDSLDRSHGTRRHVPSG